mmetsp:Transcript_24077/g.44479  ORF Transcript_24077/g.44479 Transcript_24077/m.44479 type:complete len:426 (-) Transcript_24077:181-1458(-)
MQGLVRDAEQRAVRNAEPITVCGDGRAFHIKRDGPRLAEPLHWSMLVTQFPIAVVIRGHSARAHDPLQLIAFQFGDPCHGLFQGDLDLCQRGDRHPRGQIVVQHMILAQIGVAQHEVAQRLRVAQARAVPDHQPGMGAQHSNVVSRGFGVRWPDPDIDQRDPRPVRPFQVIGRHLWHLARLCDHPVARGDDRIASRDKGGIAAVWVVELLTGIGLELGHIELIVGEQHEVLEMHRIGGGVMRQPRQRIVDALGGEGGQRLDPILGRIGPIDDVIIGVGQVGHVKDVAQGEIPRPFLGHSHGCVVGNRKVDGHGRVGKSDLHLLIVIGDQEPDLLGQVVLKEVRPGDRCGIGAGARHVPKAEPRVDLRIAGRGQPHFGVVGPDASVWRAFGHGGGKVGVQEIRRLIIKLPQQGNRRDGVIHVLVRA